MDSNIQRCPVLLTPPSLQPHRCYRPAGPDLATTGQWSVRTEVIQQNGQLRQGSFKSVIVYDSGHPGQWSSRRVVILESGHLGEWLSWRVVSYD